MQKRAFAGFSVPQEGQERRDIAASVPHPHPLCYVESPYRPPGGSAALAPRK